ncbi:hypothetical protein DAPPUDRAFT_102345 [Daphnia pulex]|uniref:Apple domain-containing protein n=1 Tax=Daphnia pulex TaxID=6669 RepID=E9GG65_DAPPU|nr:hypothetical protein DAPPUDRAFT_102345 [Daphnia pulex]|eukprot:EFX81343.1 hypothetical protein DAPPUDRAFT_102345 [Daphnia pulex]
MMQKICIMVLFTVVSVIADTDELENPVLVPETNAEATQLAEKGKNPGPKQNEWKTTREGIKWLPNCDFPGYDIKYENIGGRCSHCKCSDLCTDTSGCNAFSWMDGWCYLKNLPAAALKRSPSNGGGCGCGFLPWEFE